MGLQVRVLVVFLAAITKGARFNRAPESAVTVTAIQMVLRRTDTNACQHRRQSWGDIDAASREEVEALILEELRGLRKCVLVRQGVRPSEFALWARRRRAI